MEVEVTIRFITNIIDWYENERLTNKQKLKLIEEDFQSLKYLLKYIPDYEYKVKVKN